MAKSEIKIGSLIRAAREAAGISQVEAAKRSGFEQSHWARWEADGQMPRADTLFKIADALGCKLEKLRPKPEVKDGGK